MVLSRFACMLVRSRRWLRVRTSYSAFGDLGWNTFVRTAAEMRHPVDLRRQDGRRGNPHRVNTLLAGYLHVSGCMPLVYACIPFPDTPGANLLSGRGLTAPLMGVRRRIPRRG